LYILDIQPGEKTKREAHSLLKMQHMKDALKQVVGIDVGQKELVVSMGSIFEDFTSTVMATRSFANNAKGFAQLLTWVSKHQTCHKIAFVMEATGIYHQRLAYYLHQQRQPISIVLPNKISHYMRTLDIKTVTDQTAAEAIMQFGLERKLAQWQPPKDSYLQRKQLTRERDQLIVERTSIKNQLHAEQAEACPNPGSLNRIRERMELLDQQEAQIRAEISVLIAASSELKGAVALLSSIPGIGKLTAAIILAETQGFELITNRRQLASYAGFDIKEKQSGTSVRGKATLSKRGNKYLRKAMYLPALAAIRTDPRSKALFERLVSGHGIKMKACVAVQRKLLEMTFTLFKAKTPYNKHYLHPLNVCQQGVAALA
jgi:transposase